MKKMNKNASIILVGTMLLSSCQFEHAKSSKGKSDNTQKTTETTPSTEATELPVEKEKSQETEPATTLTEKDVDLSINQDIQDEILKELDQEVNLLVGKTDITPSTKLAIGLGCGAGAVTGIYKTGVSLVYGLKALFVDFPVYASENVIYAYDINFGSAEEATAASTELSKRASEQRALPAQIGAMFSGLPGKAKEVFAELEDESIPSADRAQLGCEITTRALSEAALIWYGPAWAEKLGNSTKSAKQSIDAKATELMKSEKYQKLMASKKASLAASKNSFMTGKYNLAQKAKYEAKLATMAIKSSPAGKAIGAYFKKVSNSLHNLKVDVRNLGTSIRTGSTKMVSSQVARVEDGVALTSAIASDQVIAIKKLTEAAKSEGVNLQIKARDIGAKVHSGANIAKTDSLFVAEAMGKTTTGKATIAKYRNITQKYLAYQTAVINASKAGLAQVILVKKSIVKVMGDMKDTGMYHLKVKKTGVKVKLSEKGSELNSMVKAGQIAPNAERTVSKFANVMERGDYTKTLKNKTTNFAKSIRSSSTANVKSLNERVSGVFNSTDKLVAKINKKADEGIKKAKEQDMRSKLEAAGIKTSEVKLSRVEALKARVIAAGKLLKQSVLPKSLVFILLETGRAQVVSENQTAYFITKSELLSLDVETVVTHKDGETKMIGEVLDSELSGLSDADLTDYGFIVENN